MPKSLLIAYALFALAMTVFTARAYDTAALAIMIASLVMFAACFVSAARLLGLPAAKKFALLAVSLGWFAEQMGSSDGWFFGSYTYTDVLGPRIGNVPVVIPLMWFALCFTGYVLASLILWRKPLDASASGARAAGTALIAAMIVTAFDLGADPYFVFVMKAWIMTKKDGWWFGETVQGFAGWMLIGFFIIFSFRLWARDAAIAVPPRAAMRAALVPLGIYASGIAFQVMFGHPVETRSIAVFAMGIPLLCAIGGWLQWRGAATAAQDKPGSSARFPLEGAQLQADPLADETIAKIVGPWDLNASSPQDLIAANAKRWERIALANHLMAAWASNGMLDQWQPPPGIDPLVTAPLQDYLAAGTRLPDWADPQKIARAEALFYDYGPLSCILLFCASLPECYVLPDLADVLHTAGQLEKHTEYRIRSTAAMIFPVMMHGGLTAPDGGGVAQVLKVRLIHATIRNLILRGDPLHAGRINPGIVPPLPPIAGQQGMHQTLFAHGWNVPAQGLPCNQEELAYTLLTFNYIFLRSLRKLGLGLPPEDESAYLHTWNLMAHVLGVRRELMAENMEQAKALFDAMQARGRSDPRQPDVRAKLGEALINTMQDAIKLPVIKHFPALMTRSLCGAATAAEIGVTARVPLVADIAFTVLMLICRVIDTLARLIWPQFALSRLVTRVIGYHLMVKVLLDQTRPLKLPQHLLNRVNTAISTWGNDAKAPRWVNALEDALTVKGPWQHTRKTPVT